METSGRFMKIVIWGHKLHSHTHSYIHEGFFRAFRALGYDTSWLDDNDDVSNFNFANTIFLTEGQVDSKIPIRDDCKYILHYCNPEKYQSVIKNCLFLERSMICQRERLLSTSPSSIVEPWVYFEENYKGTDGWKIYNEPLGAPALYILWATDLLPDEINMAWADYERSNDVNWVGTIGSGIYGNATELGPYALAAIRSKHNFNQSINLSRSVHIAKIQQSYTSPVIVGNWQLQNGYIPCRLFKNISYGQLPCTNSKYLSEVFDNKIKCNIDTHELFFEVEQDVHLSDSKKDLLKELMISVKENHTYVSRVKSIMKYLPKD